MRRKYGFTLVEVLTVIAIIGILSTLTAYGISSASQRSRDNQRLSDLQLIRSTLEQYYLDYRTYPKYMQASGGDIFAARWQLESGFGCGQSSTRKYLAPDYINLIPEDPRSKFNNSCGASQPGQYLYLPVKKSDTKPIKYFLAAKVERSVNASLTLPDFVAAEYNNISWFAPCNKQDFENNPNSCTHNFFLTGSRND